MVSTRCVEVDCNLILLPVRSGINLARRYRHIVGKIDDNVPLLLDILGLASFCNRVHFSADDQMISFSPLCVS